VIEKTVTFSKGFLKLPFDVNFVAYIILASLMLGLLLFRPEGVLPEQPVRTVSMEVEEDEGSSSEGRGS